MAYLVGNLLRLTVRQEYDSQQCLNVFYYKILTAAVTSTPAIVGETFWNYIQDQWRGSVSDAVTFDRIIIENLDGDLSYGEYVIPEDEREGTNAGQPMSAFNAYAIQLNRTSRLTRNGAKRIVGVFEASVDSFGVITSGHFPVIQDLADLFAGDVMAGILAYLQPVIVGFPNDNRPDRVEVAIDTATANPMISTQNTRKRGHGS